VTHVFRLSQLKPQFVNAFGRRKSVTKEEFPILKRLSIYLLELQPGAFREPHWHPNANELGYCMKGSLLITIFGNGNVRNSFTIDKGEMFFVPSGFLHAIENVGPSTAEVTIAFSNEAPEDIGMSGSAGAMTLEVMGNTWGMPASHLSGLTRSLHDIVIGKSAGAREILDAQRQPSDYKFSVEEQNPPGINTPYGGAKLARGTTWPILKEISMFSLRILGTGMREPHWHPDTAEMGYVVDGHARMTIRSPGSAVETYTLEAGDMYFIPRAYPHHIENIGSDTTHFLIFFDQATGGDIGYTGGLSAFPTRIVTPTLAAPGGTLPLLPNTPADLALVKKTNPVVFPEALT
jgi:oxalate decarboxylase